MVSTLKDHRKIWWTLRSTRPEKVAGDTTLKRRPLWLSLERPSPVEKLYRNVYIDLVRDPIIINVLMKFLELNSAILHHCIDMNFIFKV